MSALFSLSRDSIQLANRIITSQSNRTDAFVIGLAYIIAQSLPVPGTAVDDPHAYYNMNYRGNTECKLSQFNELFPFDLKKAEEYILAIFSFRCYSAYDLSTPILPIASENNNNAIFALFGINKFFSNEFIDCVNKNSSAIVIAMAGIRKIKEDLEAKEKAFKAKYEEANADQKTGVYE